MVYYESFYGGNPSSLEKSYEKTFGKPLSLKELGTVTNAQTANQVDAISKSLSTGLKTIEVNMLAPEIIEAIPKQHLKDIGKMAEMAKANLTVHGLMAEPSGFTQQGWNDLVRKQTEDHMFHSIASAHEISPKENINVTFHSSASLPKAEVIDPKTGDVLEMYVVNKDSKQIVPLKREEEYLLGRKEAEIGKLTTREVADRLKSLNNTQWHDQTFPIVHQMKDADELLMTAAAYSQQKNPELAEDMLKKGNAIVDNISAHIPTLFDKALKFDKSETAQKALQSYAKQWREFNEEMRAHLQKEDKSVESNLQMAMKEAQLVKHGAMLLAETHPDFYQPLNEFAIDQSSETFSNLALKSYKEFKGNSPVISIENPPASMALSTGKELRELVDESKKKFVEKAVKGGLMSKGEAEETANKLIGATWDVGHINMLRKYGYEEKHLLAEAEKIKPVLKHMHLSDNFGFEHGELPMGMGNVPIAKMLKTLGKEGESAKKIIEAASWMQHHSMQGAINPIKPTLELAGNPIYASQGGPTWSQYSNVAAPYFAGYGTILPEQHFSLYGSGFATLPAELGGQMQGRQSRFAGTPNA